MILEHDASVICQAGLWYGRQMGSRHKWFLSIEPLMVAATYGSLDVLKLILAQPEVDVNFSDVPDKSTALHCAASGGSVDADEIVKLLLESGADANAMDMNGRRPFDINTSYINSPKSVEHPRIHASFNVSSPGRMSPRSVEPISPINARLSALALRDQQQLRSLSSREFGIRHTSSLVGSPVNSWSNWGSPNGKVDWSVNGGGNEIGRLRRSSSFELGNNGEEPDLSWVQYLVKESPPEMEEKHVTPVSGTISSGEGLTSKASNDPTDYSVVGAWLEHMQLDQMVSQ